MLFKRHYVVQYKPISDSMLIAKALLNYESKSICGRYFKNVSFRIRIPIPFLIYLYLSMTHILTYFISCCRYLTGELDKNHRKITVDFSYMATHSSVPDWRIPGTGKPGGLPSTGSHRVRHD